MLKKEANKITGGLSKPSKMPGPAYNLPAAACITGAKLVKIPGSVCAGCYALKGRYRFKNVQDALQRRLQATPDTQHWMPTREAQILKRVKVNEVPRNLIIRMSSHMVDQGPVSFWPWTSTVVQDNKSCPAQEQGNECKSCRQCWDRSVRNVAYPKH